MGVLARFERFGDGAAGPALDRGACSIARGRPFPRFHNLVARLGSWQRELCRQAPVAHLGRQPAHLGGGELLDRAVEPVHPVVAADDLAVGRKQRNVVGEVTVGRAGGGHCGLAFGHSCS